MFKGDFGFKNALRQIEDEVISTFSLWTDQENKISLPALDTSLQFLTLNSDGEDTNLLDAGALKSKEQRDFLPKQHPMESRSFERVLKSYNFPQYITPQTTPTDIDLQEKRLRKQLLSSELHREEIKSHIHIKLPDRLVKDNTEKDLNKRKCNKKTMEKECKLTKKERKYSKQKKICGEKARRKMCKVSDNNVHGFKKMKHQTSTLMIHKQNSETKTPKESIKYSSVKNTKRT